MILYRIGRYFSNFVALSEYMNLTLLQITVSSGIFWASLSRCPFTWCTHLPLKFWNSIADRWRIEQMREKGRKNNKFLLNILITWTDFFIYFLFGFPFQSDIISKNACYNSENALLYEMPSNLKGKNFVSKFPGYCPQNTMAFFSSKLDGIKK